MLLLSAESTQGKQPFYSKNYINFIRFRSFQFDYILGKFTTNSDGSSTSDYPSSGMVSPGGDNSTSAGVIIVVVIGVIILLLVGGCIAFYCYNKHKNKRKIPDTSRAQFEDGSPGKYDFNHIDHNSRKQALPQGTGSSSLQGPPSNYQ